MQVAATNPNYIHKIELPEEALQKAKEVFAPEVEGKPEEMKEKIMEGKLASYFREQILMEQPFIKNSDLTIGEMVTGAVQKFGENVSIVKISRVSVK